MYFLKYSISSLILSGLDYPNREGHWPFFPSSDAETGKYLPDLSRPNPDYFAFVDRVVRLAASLDIVVTIVPTWGRYVNGGFYEEPILFNESNAYTYGRFLGERYPAHPFVLGGDSVRYWHPKTTDPKLDKSSLDIIDTGPVWEAMAKGLIEGEQEGLKGMTGAKGYETFMTYHSCQCELLNETREPVSMRADSQAGIRNTPKQRHPPNSPMRRGSVWTPFNPDTSMERLPSKRTMATRASRGISVTLWKCGRAPHRTNRSGKCTTRFVLMANQGLVWISSRTMMVILITGGITNTRFGGQKRSEVVLGKG